MCTPSRERNTVLISVSDPFYQPRTRRAANPLRTTADPSCFHECAVFMPKMNPLLNDGVAKPLFEPCSVRGQRKGLIDIGSDKEPPAFSRLSAVMWALSSFKSVSTTG